MQESIYSKLFQYAFQRLRERVCGLSKFFAHWTAVVFLILKKALFQRQKTAVVLGVLFFSCFSFSDSDWEPDEDNCKPGYGLTAVNCIIEDNKCKQDPDPEAGKFYREKCEAEMSEDGTTVVRCASKDTSQYEDRKQACEEWREREEEQADREQEAEADSQKMAEEQRKEQQTQMEDRRGECREQYSSLVSQRDRLESDVQKIEDEIDKNKQAVINESVSTSQAEDQLRQRITQLKDKNRKILRDMKKAKDDLKDQHEGALASIEIEIEKQLRNLELAQIARQTACTERFNAYKLARDNCYNQALAEVEKERDEYYTKVYSGEQEFASQSDVLGGDFQSTEARFTQLLNARSNRCYHRAIGSTEVVACSLQVIQQRNQACQSDQNKPQCPTPEAVVIENKLRDTLANIKVSEEDAQSALDKLYEQLKKLPGRKKQDFQDLARQLKDEQENFNEEMARLQAELEEKQLLSFQKIRELTEKNQRLMERDPGRHFGEKVKTAQQACCPNIDFSSCSQLNNYLTDARRLQFLFIKPAAVSPGGAGPGGGASR